MKDEYQVGYQFHDNALAIIHDVDSVFCLFPGPWNGCTEVPEHAKRVCDALNKHDPLPSDAVHGNAVNIGGEWMDWRDALAAEQARAERLELVVKQYASECGGCNGTGFVGVKYWRGDIEFDADDQPCPDCADIRAALALRPSGDGVGK